MLSQLEGRSDSVRTSVPKLGLADFNFAWVD